MLAFSGEFPDHSSPCLRYRYVTAFSCFLFLQKDFLSKYPPIRCISFSHALTPLKLTTWGFSVGMTEMDVLAYGSGALGDHQVCMVMCGELN